MEEETFFECWRGGEIFQWWQNCWDCPGLFPCHLVWAMSFSCVCVYMQELFQPKRLLSRVYSCIMLCTTCLFKGCKSLQLRRGSHVTEKSLLPPFGPVIPFLTWATPTHPGLRGQSLPLSGKQESSFFPILQNNNAASPCFSHTHCKQFPEHPG